MQCPVARTSFARPVQDVPVTRPRPTARRLLVARHAEAAPTAASDHERELTANGRLAARGLGEWLKAEGLRPDRVLASDATRIRRTWEEVALAAGWEEVAIDFLPGLYAAGPESALDLVRATSDDVSTLLLIGHNPTVASLAHLLQDGRGSEGAAVRMAQGYPPAATTLLAAPGGWADLEWGGARLVEFHLPRSTQSGMG